MHEFEMPQEYVERVIARQGRAHTCESFDGPTTALLVVDMQNYFVDERYQAASPTARDNVPSINRLAEAMRQAGGRVIWVQNAAPWESERSWATQKERYLPEKARLRWEAMQPEAEGFRLWPRLEVHDNHDLRVVKRRYSAFTRGSSDIEIVLQDHGLQTLLITGVATNACCESTARDAMMLNYRAVMVSDGCAAVTDREHAAALENFYLYFGDVLTTSEVIERLRPGAA